MAKLSYGYMITGNGNAAINQQEADTIKMIFKSYLSGSSLGKIAAMLSEKRIPSPSGKDVWTRSALDKLLSNGKYVPHIIDMEQFVEVQIEKATRSNIGFDTGKRKAARYNSQNVLSGLLVCAECGANYRRITPASGEVVWRCANRVEHGKEICKHSPAVKESEMKESLCNALNISGFDESVVRGRVKSVLVNADGVLDMSFRQEHEMVISM